MKFVLANRYFFPDQSATSRMVSSLAFTLRKQGFAVTAVASRHLHDRHDVILPARENVDGVDVHRLPTSGFGRRRIVGRAADYATFHLAAAAWWLRHARRGDICVVCTDPPLLSVTSALPITLRGGKMVNWEMDLFPETAIELGLMSRTGVLARTALALRDASLRAADLTVCPMQAMSDYLQGIVSTPGRFATVHHWSDGREIHPVAPADNRLRREWGVGDKFVVGYSGNFGRAHEFTTLLDAAEALREDSRLCFLLIGDGQKRAETEAEARRRKLTNIIFKDYQPPERLAESLSAAEIHIVSLLPTLEYCIVPSKFYGILAAGRPTLFIGDPEGEVARVCRDANCGISVAPGDSAMLAEQILRLRDQPVERERMGKNARQLMETEYALSSGVERWHRAVAPLLPREGTRSLPTRPGEATT